MSFLIHIVFAINPAGRTVPIKNGAIYDIECRLEIIHLCSSYTKIELNAVRYADKQSY